MSRLITYLLYRSRPFVPVTITAACALLLLRIVEIFFVTFQHPDITVSIRHLAEILLYDVVFIFFSFALFTPIYFLIEKYSAAAAQRLHIGYIAFQILLAFLLSKYFSVTLVPLSSDVYGYSWNDISETIAASGGIDAGAVAAGLFVVLFLAAIPYIARSVPTPRFVLSLYYAASLLSIPAFFVAEPDLSGFGSVSDYNLALNKSRYFLERSTGYFLQKVFGGSEYSAREYPFLHAADTSDVLGPFFFRSEKMPNIVFVIVEGLGSDFVSGGMYGGFTPYFDSLARHGLYWKNFLSTTGRTFGVLPSLLGSLPYGEKGFMEMGPDMPDHLTLVSLLKENGYHTSFFYSGNANFDLQDLFLEYQHLDRLVDQQQFTAAYAKSEESENGFSWGYADRDLFRRSFEVADEEQKYPRLDLYLTLSTHEPFIPPGKEHYLDLFYERLSALRAPEETMERIRNNSAIFSSLLYADDALRFFFETYKRRSEYANTMFIITGDHRLIPIPQSTTLDRFRVPLLIVSPLVRQPEEFLSVSFHSDVVPSLIAFLEKNYSLTFPKDVHWIGAGLDTAREFRNIHSRALMRNKNELIDFVDKEYFLADGRLYTIAHGLSLEPVVNDSVRNVLTMKLDRFKQINRYVCENNKLYPMAGKRRVRWEPLNYDSIYASLNLKELNTDQQFNRARTLAFNGQFVEARAICVSLLSRSPNYHDVRTLLGRTYAWDHQYDRAKEIFLEVIRRSPQYPDAFVGIAQVEFWSSEPEKGLASVNKALDIQPENLDARLLKAKILRSMEKRAEALDEVNAILAADPSFEEAEELYKALREPAQ
ncbi:MAG: sulfatase-like hydrolase/transferase [Bacteroidota bacterium]